MRCFIAVPLKEWEEPVEKVIECIRKGISGIKWVEKENVHITLKFLGETEEGKREKISDILQKISSQYSSFQIKVTSIGAFPSSSQPRVIWLGVDDGGVLKRIAEEIENALIPLGWEKEGREFHPHITLGRVKKKVNKGWWKGVMKMELPNFPPLKVRELILYQSILGKEGPTYIPLNKFLLGGENG
ncbi:RNA 2',3'-cyclic phosphodiesterase [Candidatus Calescamantes bacterium]|nr:RNA 2',3'-cyclic phosphodiesterase [Candidatus Calescamantes bacterium]